jgi:hypothetical protein
MQNQQHDSPQKKIFRSESNEDSTIIHHCGITEENIAEFANGIVEQLDSKLFYAFLCQLTTFIPHPTSNLIFSPDYNLLMRENGEEALIINYYGNKEAYDMAIIPVKVNDYYGIAIFEKGASIHYYDPFYNDITPETRQHLRTVVRGIVDENSIVKVYQTKTSLFNKATSINEATIICCIIAERYLMHSKRTYIDNFNIHQETDNIVKRILESIITGEKLYLDEEISNEEGSYINYQMCRLRESEANDAREERLRKEKEKRRLSREEEIDDVREVRLRKDKENKRFSREEESDDVREERLRNKREKIRFDREEEIDDDREERLRKDRENKRLSLEEESTEERDIRNSSRRMAYRQALNRRRNSIYLQGRYIDDDMPQHRLNEMDTICIHCGALHFIEEATARSKNSFNDCCRFVIL